MAHGRSSYNYRPGPPRRPSGKGRGSGGGGRRGPEPPNPKQVQRPLPQTAFTFDKVRFRPGDVQDTGNLNLGLWLDKLVPLAKDDAASKRAPWTLQKDLRAYVLEQMFCREWRSAIGQQVLERQQQAVFAESRHMQKLVAKVEGRLLVDAGRTSSIETTLSFHHTWGIPRIPGSAIKGMVRAAMEEEHQSQTMLDRLFGPDLRDSSATASKGALFFYDALPDQGRYRLSLDVLTPHFPEYYQGNKPPADWQSPVPHTFLTVVDTSFVFHVVASSKAKDEDLEDVRQALIDGMEYFGIGGKRAAGYGRLLAEKS